MTSYRVQQLEWLLEQERNNALEKAAKVVEDFGYTIEWPYKELAAAIRKLKEEKQ